MRKINNFILFFFVVFIVASILFIISADQIVTETSNSLYNKILTEKKQNLKNKIVFLKYLVNNLDYNYSKKLFLEIVESYNKSLKNKDNYIFVIEFINSDKYLGKMIINPNAKNLEGKLLPLDFKDIKNKEFRKEIKKIVLTKKEGFVSYFYKASDGKIHRKLTYIEYLPKLNYIVGSGIYVNREDILEELIKKRNKLKVMIESTFLVFLLISIVVIVWLYLKLKEEFEKNINYSKLLANNLRILNFIFKINNTLSEKILNKIYKYVGDFQIVVKTENGYELYDVKEKIRKSIIEDVENFYKVKFKNFTLFYKAPNKYKPIFYNLASKLYIENYIKELEKNLQQTLEELKKKNFLIKEQEKFSILRELIISLSHYIRQPLNVISISNMLLQNNGDIKLLTKQIENSLNQISNIINTFSELTQKNFYPKIVDIKETFEKVMLFKDYEPVQVELQTEIESCKFYVIEQLLIEIFLSLYNLVIKNSKKLKITIRCKKDYLVILYITENISIDKKEYQLIEDLLNELNGRLDIIQQDKTIIKIVIPK